MDHSYRIEGHVNGRHVLGVGAGSIDPDSGLSELEVTFQELPEGWDPRSIVLMCCGRSTVMASREHDGAVGMFRSSGGYMTIGRHLVNGLRKGMMRDASGKVMADVQASSVTDFRDDPYDQSRIEGGVSHLRPGKNGIAEIRPFTGVMVQSGPNLVNVTTTYEALLEDGTTLYGTTFYPHYLPEQRVAVEGIQLLTVHSIAQQFDGRRLSVRAVSDVRQLSEPLVESMEPLASSATVD